MDPLTIALFIITTVSSTLGGIAQAKKASTEADIAERNKDIIESNAQQALRRREETRRDILRSTNQSVGLNEAQVGALNVGRGGSAEDVIEDQISRGLTSILRNQQESNVEQADFSNKIAEQDFTRRAALGRKNVALTGAAISLGTLAIGGVAAGASSLSSFFSGSSTAPALATPGEAINPFAQSVTTIA